MGTVLHNRFDHRMEKHIGEDRGKNINHVNDHRICYDNIGRKRRFNVHKSYRRHSSEKSLDVLDDDINFSNYRIYRAEDSSPTETYQPCLNSRAQMDTIRSAGHHNGNVQMQSKGTQVSLPEGVANMNYNSDADVLWRHDASECLRPHCRSQNRMTTAALRQLGYDEPNATDTTHTTINNNDNIYNKNWYLNCLDNGRGHQRQLQRDYNSNHRSTLSPTIARERYDNDTKENYTFRTTQSENSSPCSFSSGSPMLSSPYDSYADFLSKSLSSSPSSISSSPLSSSSPSPSVSPLLSPLLHNRPKKTSNTNCSYYSNTYQQYYQRRFLRTRKFRLNLFMYANLYRKQRRSESNYDIYHNPMEDPDAIYTSFSNPNYFLNRPKTLSTSSNNNKPGIHGSNNNSDETASLEKLSLASDASDHYSDYSSCEPTPTTPDRSLILHKLHSGDEYDDYDDLADDDSKLDENKSLIESRNSDDSCDETTRLNEDGQPREDGKGNEPHVYYGIGGLPWSKSKGILGYLEMLEKQAMARTSNDEKQRERSNNDGDDGKEKKDDEQEKAGPKASGDGENPNEQQENEKFEHTTEINSPDSNDSGIQPGDKILSPDCPSDIETTRQNEQDHKSPTKAVPEKLPDGWQRHEDEDGPYFWHVKSGTIQREPPPPAPPDGPSLCSPRSISLASDSASTSSSSMPSTPTSVGSITERHLAEFEGQALQYAAKSLQAMSQADKKSSSGADNMGGEKGVRFTVRSLGWVRIAEEDLNPERSSRAVNKCIVDLSLGRNDLSDSVGRWGDGKELYMDLDQHSLRLVNPTDGVVFNSQPIHSIRVWGVGRDNGRERDFAYVARDRKTRIHMCHVFHCDVPARQIANTLRDICKKIMLERNLHHTAVSRLARPTDLPNLDKVGQHTNGEKLSFQNLYNNARFPTPMEEPRKIIRSHYLGVTEVPRPTGRDLLNEAMQSLYYRIPPEKWIFVNVAIAPSTITITEHGYSETILEECRVRFLSFMGIAVDNVKLCAFIMHTAQNKFMCHVFHCEPSAGPLCKTIEAACKLRYQKCMDAHPQTNKGGLQAKSLRSSIKQSIQCVWGSVTNLTSPK